MRYFILFLLGGLFLFGYKSNPLQDPYKVSQYFLKNEQDTLLANIITYVDAKAPGATDETRFDPQFRQDYVRRIPNFSIENYCEVLDGTCYFFLIRPVGNSATLRRGVLGKFELGKGSLIPKNFEEIVNTPHLEESLVKERGNFLFRELIKNGDLNKHLALKHYVEWPDSTLKYNRKKHEWVATGM